eukprot:gene9312-9508_t
MATFVAAPSAGRILADLGMRAEARELLPSWRVEEPTGDAYRRFFRDMQPGREELGYGS